MNDFTKEELLYIASLFARAQLGEHPLFIKIDDMIANYCEHEKIENIGGWVSKCVKCGLKFGDETQ